MSFVAFTNCSVSKKSVRISLLLQGNGVGGVCNLLYFKYSFTHSDIIHGALLCGGALLYVVVLFFSMYVRKNRRSLPRIRISPL